MSTMLPPSSSVATARKRFAVVCDYPQEGWTSMDLVADKLYEQISRNHADRYDAQKLIGPWTWRAGLIPSLRKKKLFFNTDRLINRHFAFPRYLKKRAKDFDLFHVADHSYSMQVHALPAERTGVFCHDLDAYRSILLPQEEPRPKWYRAMTRRMLRGLQDAALVFYTTDVVRSQIDHHGILDPKKLVQAPYGVGEFFKPQAVGPVTMPDSFKPHEGRPYLLHVGTCNPRKRMDVLLKTFAAVRASHPELLLVQIGGKWQPDQEQLIDQLGVRDGLYQPGRQSQDIIAEFVRRAKIALLPSEREGFGLPVAETLACGTILVASDIPVLREVGGDAAVYAPLADIDAWASTINDLLANKLQAPPLERRLAVAGKYTWENHANTILAAYERLG